MSQDSVLFDALSFAFWGEKRKKEKGGRSSQGSFPRIDMP
jgi:hypothetical protein